MKTLGLALAMILVASSGAALAVSATGSSALTAGTMQAGGAQADPSLEAELIRLDQLRRSGKMSRAEAIRLAELYFLTSRCTDIKALSFSMDWAAQMPDGDKTLLKKELSLLVCGCGDKCSDDQPKYSALQQFRGLLDSGVSWHDARVQGLWKSVNQMPEARYWALKSLRAHNDYNNQTVRRVRLDLEKSLESLEVN